MSQSTTRIVTHADIARVADGGHYYLEDGAELTPLARERALARGIELRRAGTAAQAMAVSQEALTETIERVLGKLGPLSQEDARRVIAEVVAEVTGSSDGASVGLPASADYCTAYLASERKRQRRRAVLTASGRNQKGIVARLTTVIAELGGDILDISQTLVGDYFTMLVIIDIGELESPFETFKESLIAAARDRGVSAILMHEDLVTSMHRV